MVDRLLAEFVDANPILWLIVLCIWTLHLLLIAAAVLSWLIAFNVVNTRNQFVAMVGDFLYRITEPVLRPIRNACPISAASTFRR